jgi:uroporphyrinogen III methyltransferase / synthase
MPFRPGEAPRGKRVVVTRALDQAEEFIKAIESLGAEVLLLPTISFSVPKNPGPLDRAVSELDKFDWVIFTSRNAVKFLAARFGALQLSVDRVRHLMLAPKVAAIGAATSDQAWSAGFSPQFEAEESSGEALARELADQVRGKRVLLPRSDYADSRLPEALRTAGAEVMEVIAYRNVAPALDPRVLDAIRQGAVDVITFFSPSAYRHLVDEVGVETLRRQSGKISLASIGPTTSRAIRRDGLQVTIEASAASAAALAAAIEDHFRERARLEAPIQ